MLLDNPRVFVQKFIVQSGQFTGHRTHPGDQLLVFIKGGVLTSRATGRSTLWRDGRVVWHNAADGTDEGSTNTGTAPIEMIWVTFKPVAPSPAMAPPGSNPKYRYLNYPNIPGEDLLENDLVIVQRFSTVNPGQWEGCTHTIQTCSTSTSKAASGAQPDPSGSPNDLHILRRRRMARSGGCPRSTSAKDTSRGISERIRST